MALKIKFEDYSVKVTKELENAAFNFLEESGGLVESKVKDLTRVASGETRREWGHVVDKSGLKVTIGNPLENALWEERGGNPVPRINRTKSVFKLLLNYGIILFGNNEVRLNF